MESVSDCFGSVCQLTEVILYMFNLSLCLEKVPTLWKTSCMVLILKTAHLRKLSHYRPMALTSELMKTLDRIVIGHLCDQVDSTLDPLLFRYHPKIDMDDAVIYLVDWTLCGSCSLIFPVFSTPSSLLCSGGRWRMQR